MTSQTAAAAATFNDGLAAPKRNVVLAALPALPAPVKARPRGNASARALELVELELALDAAEPGRHGFAEAVKEAVRPLGAEFLFALPASGLAKGCQKIAAVRLADRDSAHIAFLFLADDGTTVTVREPDDETQGLGRFAEAFIGVLERL